MQQHTGQHLLSAVFEELFALRTVSFHLGADSVTVDLGRRPLGFARAEEVERRANEIVFENRPVMVAFQDGGGARSSRAMDGEGTVRIVSN